MAKTRTDRKRSINANSLAKLVNSITGKIYQNTYYSQSTTSDTIASLKADVDDTIQKITSNNIDYSGELSISKLYTRLYDAQKSMSDQAYKNFDDFLNDKGLIDSIMYSYNENRWIKDLDAEIDTVCKYMPKLLEALSAKRENVLSSDHYSKDYLNVKNLSNISDEAVFPGRIKELKEEYNLAEFFDKLYDDTAKYGEQFVYILPYTEGIKSVLKKMSKSNVHRASFQSETCTVVAEGAKYPILEAGETSIDRSLYENLSLDVQLNTSGILFEQVETMMAAKDKKRSISESVVKIVGEAVITGEEPQAKPQKSKKGIKAKIIDDELSFDGIDDTASDGLSPFKLDAEDYNKVKEINGCVMKVIPREQIIPIEIEGVVMGYYYMEFSLDDQAYMDQINMAGGINATKAMSKSLSAGIESQKEELLARIANALSKFIDSKFINANQDLKKEIYLLLKHNDIYNGVNKLNVTFIPPEYMEHVYFRKDSRTHRGISDLDRALLPAKVYTGLYITNAVGFMTRGQDKRVYYVKQQVDTNTAQQLMNVINQIKKGNFGARQLDNINNILNITGRYNDYVIPVGPSGDAPITFEVMQGQDINPQTDFMTNLEELAVNNTDVPFEFIQTRQSVDFASQLTMTNTKFLKIIYNRQAKYEPYLSRIMTKLYRYEYGGNDTLEVTLPPPMFLNIVNTQSMVENARNYAQNIAEIEMSDEPDNEALKNLLIKKIAYNQLATYIDVNKIKELREIAEQELVKVGGEEDNN